MSDSANTPIFLSVVIPVYNEEKKIEKDINALYQFLTEQEYSSEVIVVDDGSRDQTLHLLKTLHDRFPMLNIIHYHPNQGKGCALKKGILAAGGDYILFADAGMCVPYAYIKTGLELLQQNCDMAIGSRRHEQSKVIKQQPKYRQGGAKLFSWIVRRFIRLKGVSDTQCGFKIFKRNVAKRIFTENKIKGFMFDIETILRAKRWGYKIGQFPIQWSNDPDTRLNPFFGSIRNIYELILIKISLGSKRKK